MENLSKILDDNSNSRNRELKIIMSINQSIIGTLEYSKVLQIISDGTADLLEIETAAIYSLKAGDDIYLEATTPPLGNDVPDFIRKANLSEHPNMKKTISTGKPLIVPDTDVVDLSIKEREVVELRGLRTILYFPFINGTTVLGVLILGTCEKSKHFSDYQIDLCQSLANQLSVAIQNSRLHADLDKYNANLEKLVSERTQELEAVNEEYKAINEEYKAINEELEATNEELYSKNNIISKQKEDIEKVLKNLKDTQSQLIQTEKMASLGTLTAGVAHEINNPLNYLMGAYIGLSNYFDKYESKEKEKTEMLINSINVGVERISCIVQGLNQFSRNNENMDEDCNIHSIIDNCLIMLHNKMKYKVDVVREYANETNIKIKGNVGKMHQVFLNILTNSIQAISEKGKIEIKTYIKQNQIYIEIIDNGIGIEAKNLKQITDPFFTTKAPGEGTGLGLSISYSIIKEHQGALLFKSKPQKGTSVTISLPFKIN